MQVLLKFHTEREQRYLPSNIYLTTINYCILTSMQCREYSSNWWDPRKKKPCCIIVWLTCYTLYFYQRTKKKYISLTARNVTQLFFLFDSQLIRHWNKAFLPITRRLSYLHTQRFCAKLKNNDSKKIK